MLRRVGIAIRWSLLVLGVALLCLWPVSYVRGVAVDFSLPRGLGSVSAFRGCCYSHFGFGAGDWLEQSPFKVKTFEPRPESGGPPLVPYWKRWPLPEGSSFTQFLIPLWLLSAVCLAWPGTSFLLAARHRGKRGFEVALVDDAPRLRDQRAEG